MSSVVRATDLLPEELEILRQNVEFAVANDGDAELPAVNRSLASARAEMHNNCIFKQLCAIFTPVMR